jgi:hypothetical protein
MDAMNDGDGGSLLPPPRRSMASSPGSDEVGGGSSVPRSECVDDRGFRLWRHLVSACGSCGAPDVGGRGRGMLGVAGG